MGDRKKTIRIAGAGPAGLCAAINLAKAGFAVEVFEREKDVGARWAGSFQCLENYSRKEDVLETLQGMGVTPDFSHKPVYGLKVFGRGDKAEELRSKNPLWYVVRRGKERGMLDYSLKKQALEAGVRINFGFDCIAQKPERPGVLEIMDVKISGFNKTILRMPCWRHEIIATGPSSAEGIAKEMVFETDAPDQMAIILDNEIAPKGYAYLLVQDGIGTVCVAIMEGFGKLNGHFEASRKRLEGLVDFNVRKPKFKANFVSFYLTGSAVRGNERYVGEAAGFQDFVFGFGLRYAFSSGYLAAKSIIEGRDYDSLWKKEFGKSLENGILNRAVYEIGGDSALSSLIGQAKARGDLREFLNGWSMPTVSKGFLIPIAKVMLGRKNRDCGHKACDWCPKRRS